MTSFLDQDGWQIELTREGSVWSWAAFYWKKGRVLGSCSYVIPRLTAPAAERAAKRCIKKMERHGGFERRTIQGGP